MNKGLLTLLAIMISGCTSSEVAYYLTHPTDSSNDPSTAAVYAAAAIVLGEIKGECNHGHPEDQIKCKKAKNSSK
ncbi:MAG: hypothetical protein ACPG52_00555 [Cognaticolwellia sp.]